MSGAAGAGVGPGDWGRAGILPFPVLKSENLRSRPHSGIGPESEALAWPRALPCFPLAPPGVRGGRSPAGALDAWSWSVLGVGSSQSLLSGAHPEGNKD